MKKALGWVVSLVVIGVVVAYLVFKYGIDQRGRAPQPAPDAARVGTPYANPVAANSPLHKPFQKYLAKLAVSQQFQDLLRSTGSNRHPLTIGFDLAKQGMDRLDDASLDTRLRIVGDVIRTLDARTCSVMVRGNPQNPQEVQQGFFHALEQLGSATADEWLELSFNAMQAELNNVPLPATEDEKTRNAFAQLLAGMEPDASGKLDRILSNSDDFSDTENCWAGRTLYSEARKMQRDQRLIIARALARD
ncbi:MAG: hypothetical protein ACREUA_05900 [Burkholderiales bacterium]